MTNHREWPLVVFTLATQFACGLALACAVADASGEAGIRPLGVATFPVIAVGILCSLRHLGRPWDAWKAFLNLGHSLLSRELLVTALFATLALAYSAMWFAGITELRVGLGIATAVCGVAAVLASAAIYTIPSQPFWNAGWLPLSFVGTTLLLGGAAAAALAPTRVFAGFVIAGSTVVVIAGTWMWRRAGSISTKQQVAIGAHVILAGMIPILMMESGPVMVGTIVVGAVIGRTLMFSLRDGIPRF